MIQIRSLSKSYGPVRVLDSLSVDIPRGKISGLAGPNACGKTTLVKSLLGLVFPDRGEISIDGIKAADERAREQLGYMPQAPDFPPQLSASELLRLIASLRRTPPKAKDELVEIFCLEKHLKKPLRELSTGTKQKISAVAALMFDSPLLILDEPTAGFDPIAALAFKQILKRRAESGVTILLVSHILPELGQLIDHLIFLLDGKTLFSGSIETLLQQTKEEDVERGVVALMRSPVGRIEEKVCD